MPNRTARNVAGLKSRLMKRAGDYIGGDVGAPPACGGEKRRS
jgi:hypothetical protein